VFIACPILQRGVREIRRGTVAEVAAETLGVVEHLVATLVIDEGGEL
jgi:hypothetical protein